MVARACGVSPMAVSRWWDQGCLPRTDLLGMTHYAAAIETATDGLVTADELHDDIRQYLKNKGAVVNAAITPMGEAAP